MTARRSAIDKLAGGLIASEFGTVKRLRGLGDAEGAVMANLSFSPLSRYPAPVGRTCALDLGQARVGLAIDDELEAMAHPRGVLDGRDRKGLLAALRKLTEEAGVTRFVVGLPLDMRGVEGDAARRARGLAQEIADATGCDVELWDERLTTVQAKRALEASEVRGKRAKGRIDEAAACAILQSWLDRPRRARG